MRRSASIVAVALGTLALFAPTSTEAQRELDVQDFAPALDSEGFIGIQGTAMPGHLVWNSGFTIGYARGLLRAPVSAGGGAQLVIRHRLDADVYFQLGLGDRFALAAEVPFTITQQGDATPLGTGSPVGIDGAAIGDVRLTGRFRFIGAPAQPAGGRPEGEGIAAMLRVTVPTAVGADFNGSRLPVIDVFTMADFQVLGFGLGATLGVRVRPDRERVGGGIHGSEFHWGFAVGAPLPAYPSLRLLAEMRGSTGFRGRYNRPQEVDLGARLTVENMQLSLIAGVGFPQRAVGAPDVRVVVGLNYAQPISDSDGDGVIDERDECPMLPEDLDGFQDEDGCLDPDNDNDFIPDQDDRCPNEEALEGRDEDEDGCTDPVRVTPRPAREPAPEADPEPGPASPPPPAQTPAPASPETSDPSARGGGILSPALTRAG